MYETERWEPGDEKSDENALRYAIRRNPPEAVETWIRLFEAFLALPYDDEQFDYTLSEYFYVGIAPSPEDGMTKRQWMNALLAVVRRERDLKVSFPRVHRRPSFGDTVGIFGRPTIAD